ncbi:MAG: ATP-dependent endonuclease [Geobacteraceae bacterium]
MRVLALEIYGFRGIGESRLVLSDHLALVGPNGSGKSTIVDALSLVCGRQKLVRELTEHDFTGSCPGPKDRISIVATLGGLVGNDPDLHRQWFSFDRAVVKWWDPQTRQVEPIRSTNSELCVQIGYAARFDFETLEVQQRRYFYDDPLEDPFDEDHVKRFPERLISEIGFFVLPARRTWAATISFASELFRKAVATLGGVPASTVLSYRDSLRSPKPALEQDSELKPLVDRINDRLGQILPGSPTLQLRITSTDSDSLLQALVPHYQFNGGPSLPAARQGTGLVSLQTLALLLEIGRSRIEKGQSFILALEEPELHVPPGLQRRLIGDATAVSDQILCTTHAPRVAAFFDAASIQILTRDDAGKLEGRQLAPESMVTDKNSLIQLYTDQRTRLVEALMAPRVLVPEGRIDFEWLRLLLDVVETGERAPCSLENPIPPFGSVVGVVPTRDSAVSDTYQRLSSLHRGVYVLVDGDKAGDNYMKTLAALQTPPNAIVQWPNGWGMEDVVGWAIEADADVAVPAIALRLNRDYQTLEALLADLKEKSAGKGGLKEHYMAHEDIAGAMKCSSKIVQRAELVLEALTLAALGQVIPGHYLVTDESRSRVNCKVYRFQP